MRHLAVLAILILAGCASPSAPAGDPAPWAGPVVNFPLNGTLSAFGDTWVAEMPGGGQGIWIHNDTLYWTNGGDLWIADISQAGEPVILGNLSEIGARDVDILEWDGRTYAALAGSGRGMHIVDVTDPRDAFLVTTVETINAGVHNVAAVPGTPYVYVSGAAGSRKIDVIDITDPFNPLGHSFLIPETWGTPPVPVNSNGCHDITVRPDLGRAFCAGGGSQYMSGGGETFIWDISEDPKDPRWVAMIDDPRLIYHHQAFVNDEGTILIINDEYISQNCYHVELPVVPSHMEPQVPFAAAWIYDISDESAPVQLSFVQNPSGWSGDGLPSADGNCGSHFGDLVLGQEAFVMGWYQGGTMLVDFSAPADPQILDIEPAEGSHWDSRYWRGNVYHAGADLVVTPLV